MGRIFLIVLDSFGVGEEPDAAEYGDFDVNTIRSCATSKYFSMPNMGAMGLFNIDGVDCVPSVPNPTAAYGKCQEASKDKDTTTGHWEIAGVISPKPMPKFPDGFPQEFLDAFSKRVGRGVICNKPYSGTQVINDYGDEHVKTGNLIVYTSADSVFQIAAHEDIVPLETLYEYCHIAREMLQGDLGVGRVIARPFVGTSGNYTRTPHRHDYSLEPPKTTMLDQLKAAGKDVLGVGKIRDIFEGKGLTEFVFSESNADGIEKTLAYMDRDFDGLCFVNLVDFDMLYGHRRDIDGYAKALNYFDNKLPEMVAKLRDDDIIMMTADHGCDPAYQKTTDHTREYIPFIMYGKNVTPKNLGTRSTFADIGATVLDYFGIKPEFEGTSML
ncbi:phosphopentomutase [Butyrivibrio sp. INlla16]|uniref:phosphopentomutase n=1 Tax=Butyrivibrio sp. INlla16 TaxID=1520807 RepID=UPI00089107EE|nr:phosphopentomutase [Butyrivibrio sp. INlla16]SDB43509.1 phosphopentomutase [Butyrivibrio sp. INlla16]